MLKRTQAPQSRSVGPLRRGGCPAGANLRQIQELLGHKHFDSTQRYMRVNAHELRGAIKRLRWVG